MPFYSSIKWKTVWIRLANMKTHFKLKSVLASPPTGLPSLKWKNYWKTMDPSEWVELLEQHPQLER